MYKIICDMTISIISKSQIYKKISIWSDEIIESFNLF